MPEDPPMDRRRFFRQGLSKLLKPITSAIAPFERVARKIGELDPAAPSAPSKLPTNLWLRPPGAISEKQYLQTCSRGGQCVDACPAHCIKLDVSGKTGGGGPYIDVNSAACVVCDGLY